MFVTNFPLPVRDRLKLAPADLLPLNPRLIYASFTAYGEAGEEAAKTGFDSTAYWARTGLMDQVRADATRRRRARCRAWAIIPVPPACMPPSSPRCIGARRPGSGGVVRSSLLQNGLWANGCFVQTRLFGEHVPHRPPREQAPNALANHYRCRDGRWFIMAMWNEQRQWRRLLIAIGREDLTDDPRFATKEARKQNAQDLVVVLDANSPRATWPIGAPSSTSVGVTFGMVGKTRRRD